eukprot:gene5893-9721_t
MDEDELIAFDSLDSLNQHYSNIEIDVDEQSQEILETSLKRKKSKDENETPTKKTKLDELLKEVDFEEEIPEVEIHKDFLKIESNFIEIDPDSTEEEKEEEENEGNEENEENKNKYNDQEISKITKEDLKYFGELNQWKKSKIMNDKIYGHVATSPLFSHFEKRKDVAAAKLHAPTVAGIAGMSEIPATSVVANSGGGYDDSGGDFGNIMIYMGQGGSSTKDQILTRYNQSLSINREKRIPVRLIRGENLESPYAPKRGYRYDGLYWVTNYWKERQNGNGPFVYKFKLIQADTKNEIPKQLNWRPSQNPKKKITRDIYLNVTLKKNKKINDDEMIPKYKRRKVKEEEEDDIEEEGNSMKVVNLKRRNDIIDIESNPWIDQYSLAPLGVKVKRRLNSDIDNIICLKKIETICSMKQENSLNFEINDDFEKYLINERIDILSNVLTNKELTIAKQRNEINEIRIRSATKKLNSLEEIVKEENRKEELEETTIDELLNINEFYWP